MLALNEIQKYRNTVSPGEVTTKVEVKFKEFVSNNKNLKKLFVYAQIYQA